MICPPLCWSDTSTELNFAKFQSGFGCWLNPTNIFGMRIHAVLGNDDEGCAAAYTYPFRHTVKKTFYSPETRFLPSNRTWRKLRNPESGWFFHQNIFPEVRNRFRRMKSFFTRVRNTLEALKNTGCCLTTLPLGNNGSQKSLQKLAVEISDPTSHPT